jgi:oligopeptide/dipeptide ABC transporter ATP-binding protein
VAVMYAGKIVEMAEVSELFDHPLHPYTRALMLSVPKVEENVERLFCIEGQPPDLLDAPVACSFMDRCLEKGEKCRSEASVPETHLDSHMVRCWLYV